MYNELQNENDDPTSESGCDIFKPHVHQPRPYYADSIEAFEGREVLLQEYQRSMFKSTSDEKNVSEIIETINESINNHVSLVCIVRKIAVDEEKQDIVLVTEMFAEPSLLRYEFFFSTWFNDEVTPASCVNQRPCEREDRNIFRLIKYFIGRTQNLYKLIFVISNFYPSFYCTKLQSTRWTTSHRSICIHFK